MQAPPNWDLTPEVHEGLKKARGKQPFYARYIHIDASTGPFRPITSSETLNEMSDEAIIKVVQDSPHIETTKIELTHILGPTLVCKITGDLQAKEEVAALNHARSLGVRAPIARRIVPSSENMGAVIVMDRIHGKTLEQMWPELGIIDTIRYALQLRKFISIMHKSKSSRGGGLAEGFFFTKWFDGAFPKPGMSPERFSEYINYYLIHDYHPRPDLLTRSLDTHTFVHQDLVPRNFVIDSNRQLWIVDWSYGGYYPEYFEYAEMNNPRFGSPAKGSRAWVKTFWHWKWLLFRFISIGTNAFKARASHELLSIITDRVCGLNDPLET